MLGYANEVSVFFSSYLCHFVVSFFCAVHFPEIYLSMALNYENDSDVSLMIVVVVVE